MTDISKKEKIIAIISFLAYSVILAFQRQHLFSLVYFAAIGIVIVLADKLLDSEHIKAKTVTAFLLTAIGYQTFFEIFFSTHNNLEQIKTAFACLLFFIGLFAVTNKKYLSYAVIAAPIVCFLNLKIALGYCVLLICISIVNLHSAKYIRQKKQKWPTKNKVVDKAAFKKLNTISVIICLVCIAVCIYLTFNLDAFIKENFNFFLTKFKNTPALIVTAIYLATKILKSNFKSKLYVGIGFVILLAATVFSSFVLGWSAFSLFCICIAVFFGFCCMQSTATIEAIKSDYQNHKFIFWALLICLLQ